EGYPGEDPYQWAAQTLFPVAYVTKFIIKTENQDKDYTVMPMEVKWKLDRSQHGSKRYFWTMMIMQPEYVNDNYVKEAIATLKGKKKELPYENRLRLHSYDEKLCGQILHIGPYKDSMDQTFEVLKQELTLQGYDWEPDSHDVYFNDIRRTSEEKLKTLIRVRIWKKDKAPIELQDPFKQW
ncbi:MAG: GyrI-like domain-containing protein, partial [Anaerolineaceae bacterium]|nr:GyrI-like domain-containing protein [Anaerolineaceae bacterium]